MHSRESKLQQRGLTPVVIEKLAKIDALLPRDIKKLTAKQIKDAGLKVGDLAKIKRQAVKPPAEEPEVK